MALFGKKPNDKPPAPDTTGGGGRRDTTYLGQRLTIKGNLSGDGNVIILGRLEGTCDLKGELTIAEPAFVQGEIRAGVVSVKGQTDGSVFARDKLHLEATARVRGKVNAKKISMLEGAQLDGELKMSPGSGIPKLHEAAGSEKKS
jgi:cytoskeletal protein CcmA (bactofilin family)